MKTKNAKQGKSHKGIVFFMTAIMMIFSSGALAQEPDSTQALFKSLSKVGELWVPEVKINSIQGQVGTLIGFYGGALFNKSFLLGISGGANLTHPTINYAYFGAVGQYIHNPSELIHLSGQLLLACGSAKDYENPKSGVFDNFMNVSGAPFFLMEPGINIELNLGRNVILAGGVSYRWVTGMDENDEDLSETNVTNKDLSGVNFNIGIKFFKPKKQKM